ncbi:MAG: efflux RND transporter periplasmic adaptor subunit [Acidobacteria bacterium]|nr:efflux RND transporter periplasmic adaptor subunit [Acidobacteriota bacterium]
MRIQSLLILGVVLQLSCGGDKHQTHAVQAPPKVSAKIEEVRLSKVEQTATATGTVEARTRTVLAAQVMGVVRQAPFEVGQTVRAGQTLIVLDSQQLAAGAAQAAAARTEARSGMSEATAALDGARAQLELVRSTRGRLVRLHERKSVSDQEMDEANSKLKQAESTVSMAEARLEQVRARITQADEAVTAASAQKGYATITAPFAGVIAEKLAQVGSMAVPGVPLLSLESVGGFRVALQLDESQGRTARIGMALQLMLDGPEAVATKVNELVPALDPTTRSLTVKADLPTLAGLRTGMFARGQWVVGEKEMLSVPVNAVRERG